MSTRREVIGRLKREREREARQSAVSASGVVTLPNMAWEDPPAHVALLHILRRHRAHIGMGVLLAGWVLFVAWALINKKYWLLVDSIIVGVAHPLIDWAWKERRWFFLISTFGILIALLTIGILAPNYKLADLAVSSAIALTIGIGTILVRILFPKQQSDAKWYSTERLKRL